VRFSFACPPLLALALCACTTTTHERGATGTIVDERKTGSAERVLRLEGMEVRVLREGEPYPPYLLDLKAFPTDDGVRIGVVMLNDELRFQECRRIELFADGVSVPLRRIQYLHTRGSTKWFEGWWIDVGPRSLAKLAAATKAGGAFCEAEMWLDEDQRALLKDFAVRALP
jgi:hypothetical protein